MAIFYKPGGGTDLPAGTAGDLLLYDGDANAWVGFSLGTSGHFLRVSTSDPTYDFVDLDAVFQPLDADLTALAALSTTGIAVRTGSGTWQVRSVTSSSAALTVTNGSGVSGNIALDLDADLTAIAALSSTGVSKRTGSGTWTLLASTSIGESILTAADAAAVKTLLSIPASVGDVSGPGSSTDNNVPRFDGTGGKTLQASLLSVDDAGVASGLTGLYVGPMDTMTVAGSAVSARIHAHYEDDSSTISEVELHRIASTSARAATIYGARAQAGETVVANGNRLFQMVALGHDGTDYAIAGRIYCEVNGTVGSNQVPGAWIFSCADSSGTVFERAEINEFGLFLETPLAVTEGGTGSTSASDARTALGLAIGTNVQAYSATLAAVAAGTWAGATSITTLGTIGTGTWQGTAVGISYGGTGATTAAAAFSALKQDATTSATGVVELATAAEYASGKVPDTSDHRWLYAFPADKCGARVQALNGTAIGTGVMGGITHITTPARNYISGYGHIDSNTASTTLDRGWYLTPSTNSHMTMDKLTGSRLTAQMACPSDNGRYFIGFVEANTATLTPATAASIYRFIRLGVYNNVFTWSIADGTNEVTGSLTSVGHTAGTVYEYEIVWTSSSSVTFNIYNADRSTLLETHTRTTTIPTGTTQCFFGQWCRTASTTPTWYYGTGRVRIP